MSEENKKALAKRLLDRPNITWNVIFVNTNMKVRTKLGTVLFVELLCSICADLLAGYAIILSFGKNPERNHWTWYTAVASWTGRFALIFLEVVALFRFGDNCSQRLICECIFCLVIHLIVPSIVLVDVFNRLPLRASTFIQQSDLTQLLDWAWKSPDYVIRCREINRRMAECYLALECRDVAWETSSVLTEEAKSILVLPMWTRTTKKYATLFQACKHCVYVLPIWLIVIVQAFILYIDEDWKTCVYLTFRSVQIVVQLWLTCFYRRLAKLWAIPRLRPEDYTLDIVHVQSVYNFHQFQRRASPAAAQCVMVANQCANEDNPFAPHVDALIPTILKYAHLSNLDIKTGEWRKQAWFRSSLILSVPDAAPVAQQLVCSNNEGVFSDQSSTDCVFELAVALEQKTDIWRS